MDRSLLEQTLIVVGVAAAAASLLLATTDTETGLLLIYVAGCAVALPFGAYLGVWLRLRGLSLNLFGLVHLSIWIALFWTIFALYRNAGLQSLISLVLLLAALASAWRALAWRRFLAVDWCALKPSRARPGRGLLSRGTS